MLTIAAQSLSFAGPVSVRAYALTTSQCTVRPFTYAKRLPRLAMAK